MNKIVTFIKDIPKKLGIFLVRCYQVVISPLFPGTCRFRPTCSEYTLIAIKRFGFFRGSYLGLRRILRCRPGGGFGFDPVPDTFHFRQGK